AFSQVEKGWAHIDAAAQAAGDLVRRIGAQSPPREQPWLLNVNIPNLPLGELKPPKVCRLGRRHAAQNAITMTSPYGETMYWIGGAGGALDASEGTDFHATAQGHLSLTPLSVDLTDHAALAYWAQGLGHMMAGEKP
nr:5'/3'-nucleotidase SurE [Ottowia sp.]